MDAQTNEGQDDAGRFEKYNRIGKVFEHWAAHAMQHFDMDVDLVGNDLAKQTRIGDTEQGHEMKHDTLMHGSGNLSIELYSRGRKSSINKPDIKTLVQGNVMAREFFVYPKEPLLGQCLEWYDNEDNPDNRRWVAGTTGNASGVLIRGQEKEDFADYRFQMVQHKGYWFLRRTEYEDTLSDTVKAVKHARYKDYKCTRAEDLIKLFAAGKNRVVRSDYPHYDQFIREGFSDFNQGHDPDAVAFMADSLR